MCLDYDPVARERTLKTSSSFSDSISESGTVITAMLSPSALESQYLHQRWRLEM
jgi:hypothetical protein